MNISPTTISGECNQKCSYTFQYSTSTCIANNSGQYLNISYDHTNLPPVTYNGNKYQVSSVFIHPSSIISYNGSYSAAELLIIHTPITSGQQLIVCIPIISSTGTTSQGGIMISEIISAVASYAPNAGSKTTVSLSDYNLQKVVPKKPFYSFEFQNSAFIAFDIQHAISLSANTLSALYKVTNTKTSWFTIPTGINVFYNSTGPVVGGATDDIYIDCQPINSSEEEIPIESTSSLSSSYDLNDKMIQIYNNPWFQIFLLVLAITILYFIVRTLLKSADQKTTGVHG